MPLDPKISQACFKRDSWRCRHCSHRNGLHPHHLIYQSRGEASQDTLDNLLTLCACCHRGHHDGKLEIVLIRKLTDNVEVRFIRKKGWKPT